MNLPELVVKINRFLFDNFDKVAHFCAGTMVASGALAIGHTINHTAAVHMSLTCVFLMAFGKEVWDHYHPPHTADFWDFFWTIMGALPIWITFILGTVI